MLTKKCWLGQALKKGCIISTSIGRRDPVEFHSTRLVRFHVFCSNSRVTSWHDHSSVGGHYNSICSRFGEQRSFSSSSTIGRWVPTKEEKALIALAHDTATIKADFSSDLTPEKNIDEYLKSPPPSKRYRGGRPATLIDAIECKRINCSEKPVFPITIDNIRLPVPPRKKKMKGRGRNTRKLSRSLYRKSSYLMLRTGKGHLPHGQVPYHVRFPKWSKATLAPFQQHLDFVSIKRLAAYVRQGRVDARFPITQRHFHDSGMVAVKRGVSIYNEKEEPFPYKVDIVVADADQASIDAIRRVGGSVTIVYYDELSLQAHIRPSEFTILPPVGRPNVEMIEFLERMRLRGCTVQYIKPLWLMREESSFANAILRQQRADAVNKGEQNRETQRDEASERETQRDEASEREAELAVMRSRAEGTPSAKTEGWLTSRQ